MFDHQKTEIVRHSREVSWWNCCFAPVAGDDHRHAAAERRTSPLALDGMQAGSELGQLTVFLDVDWSNALLPALGVAVLGAAGLAAIGTLLAALSASARFREFLTRAVSINVMKSAPWKSIWPRA